MTISISVDHREQAPELHYALSTNYGFTLEFCHLPHGDYLMPANILVERKTIHDFCLSIIDGRLFKQAYRLSELSENPILIVEGISYANSGIDIALEAVKGALITLAQTYRLPVLRTRDQFDTAWHLHHLYLQRQRLGKNAGPLHAYRPKTIEAQKTRVLRGLPGVGRELAIRLLEHFGSVEQVMSATSEELTRIPGLGEKKAQKILLVLHEEPSEYRVTSNSDEF